MALIDFQTALGGFIRASSGADKLQPLNLHGAERAFLESLVQSPGYLFTKGVQRSWCIRRAKTAGYLTLSILAPEVRRELLDEWIRCGGGTSSFVATESDAFLEFVASHLQNPSHELSVCRFEQATLRAGEGAVDFVAPDPVLLTKPCCRLRRGRYAGLVVFHGDPDAILNAFLEHRPLPPVSSEMYALLFGAGVEGLCSPASPGHVALWERLAEPIELPTLLQEGYLLKESSVLFRLGIVECSNGIS